MKIDEIIKKSIEIPGISIKRGEFSAELILKERDGKGSMTFFLCSQELHWLIFL